MLVKSENTCREVNQVGSTKNTVTTTRKTDTNLYKPGTFITQRTAPTIPTIMPRPQTVSQGSIKNLRVVVDGGWSILIIMLPSLLSNPHQQTYSYRYQACLHSHSYHGVSLQGVGSEN